MEHSASLLPLNSQKPLSQLIISLFVLLLVALLMLIVTILLGRIFFGAEMKEFNLELVELSSKQMFYLKFTQSLQHISMFLIPSLVVARLMTNKPASFLKIKSFPRANLLLLTVFLALVIVALNGDLGVWNSKLTLPDWLSGLESWMRGKEADASLLTSWLIISDSAGTLVINIIILAIVPAIGEEFLFRGILQRIFGRLFRSSHIAILITAILFSASHMQFYGFVPRLLLGFVYGYLFYWSRTIWVPVIAHFINNLIPVVLTHYIGWDALNENVGQIAEKSNYKILIPIALGALLLFIIWDLTKRTKTSDKLFPE